MSLQKLSLKNSKRSAFIKKTLAAIVLAGFAWLIFSAVSTNMETENLEPKIIKAPQVVKFRPESPGGMKIEHQDKKVFDLLDSNTSGGESNFVVAESKQSEKRVKALAQQAVKKAAITKKVEVVKAKETKKVKHSVKVVAKPTAKLVKVEKTKSKAQAKSVVAKKAEVKVSATSVKGWVVQLGSFRKTADAERAVTIYTKKVGNVLQGLDPYIKKADLGDKGVVYRVYFTGFKDKDHAKLICGKLQAKKQACFRTRLK